MGTFTTIYDRKPQPYQDDKYWKNLLLHPKYAVNEFNPAETARIIEFINYKSVASRIGDPRKAQLVCIYRSFKQFYQGDLANITQSELFESIDNINKSEYSECSKNHAVVAVKMYLRWLIKKGYAKNITLDEISDIRPVTIPATIKKPEDLPSPAEIHTITSNPNCTVMFSALVNTIYYTGGRVSEILNLNWADIIFENQFVKVSIKDTKTNKIRYVPCVQALHYIASWRRQYPTSIVGGPNGNNPVFVTLTNKKMYQRMQYLNARLIWQRLQDRANIHPKNGKRYYGFHTLRAAHITNLAAANVPDAVIRDIAWGNQNTQMMSHYLLLSDKTKENLILQSAGIQTEDDPVVENAVVLCPKCNAPNGSKDHYCRFCGQALTQSEQNIQNILDDAASVKPNDIVGLLALQLGITKDDLKGLIMKSL